MINLHFVCSNFYILPSSTVPWHSFSTATDTTEENPNPDSVWQVLDSVQGPLVAAVLTVLWHLTFMKMGKMRDFTNGEIQKWYMGCIYMYTVFVNIQSMQSESYAWSGTIRTTLPPSDKLNLLCTAEASSGWILRSLYEVSLVGTSTRYFIKWPVYIY